MPVLAGVAVFVVVVLQLSWPQAHGIGNNGDFGRVVCHLRIAPDVPGGAKPTEARVYPTWHRAPRAGCGGLNYRSPAVDFVRAASWVSERLPGGHVLDLRVLAALYALLLGLFVGILDWAISDRVVVRAALAVAAILILADFGFVSYFATAYSEPLGFVMLVGYVACLSWALRAARSGPLAVLAMAATGSLLVAAKPGYGYVAVPLALGVLAAALWVSRGRPRRPGRLVKLGVTVSAIVACGALFSAARWAISNNPTAFDQQDRYTAFYWQLLPHAADKEEALRFFGLSDHWLRYAGTSYFTKVTATTDPHFQPMLAHITYGKIMRYYATHPVEAAGLAAAEARGGMSPLLAYVGRSTTPDDTSYCPVCVWSRANGGLKDLAPGLLPLAWILCVLIALRWFRRRSDQRPFGIVLLVLVGVSIVQFATATLGEGGYEVTKHLYGMMAADALLAVIAVGAGAASRRWRAEGPHPADATGRSGDDPARARAPGAAQTSPMGSRR